MASHSFSKSVAALSAAGFLAACSVAATPDVAQAQLGSTASQKIELRSLKFTPNKVTVKSGTKVNFVWRETVAHNIVFANKIAKSPTLNKGVWSPDPTVFAKPGTYKYKCTLHPGMNGEFTVA